MPKVKIFRQKTGLVKHAFILLIGLGPLFNNIKVRLFLQKWLTKEREDGEKFATISSFQRIQRNCESGRGTAAF